MKTIAPEDVASETPILDIRNHYHGGQIRGALRYDPRKLLEASKLAIPLPREGLIILCADDDAAAQSVAGKLRESGYPEPVLLAGGIDGWKERGLPTESSTQEQPVPGEESAGIHLI